MEKCGIYCIENKINGKKYIGKSIDITNRWKKHIIYLNNKDLRLENKHFVNAWHLYGADNFSFYIIEECPNDMLNEREKYWIKKYDTTNPAFGYNMTSGGTGGNTIIAYSEKQLKEYKEKKRILHKSTALKGEKAPRSKLTKNQVIDIVERFRNGESDIEISEIYNVSNGTIDDIRRRKTWLSVTEQLGDWPESSPGCQHNTKKYIPVDMYSKNGEYIKTFPNARIADQETGANFKHISSCCRGKRHSCGGYVWRFSGHPLDEFPLKFDVCKPVNQYDKSGNLVATYKSISEAKEKTGAYVDNCLSGKWKTAGGFYWKYA